MADEKYTSAYTGTKIDEAVGHDHYAHDYVVECSLTGDWAYRKWASGIAECWCYKEIKNIEITQSDKWAGTDMYYKNLGRLPNYPFTFVEYPIVSATIQSTLGYALGIYNYSDYGYNNPGTAYLFLPSMPNTTGNEINVTLNYYVIGKWK